MQAAQRDKGDAGTIMVDALVAVVIVSLLIAACVLSLNLSRRLSADTRQMRQARQVLAALVEVVPHVPGQYDGIRDGVTYQVTVVAQGDANLCRIEAETTGRHVYRLEASRWCRTEHGT